MQLATKIDRPLPAAWVKKLRQRLAAMYGAKFIQQWEGIPEPELDAVWAEELAGYSGEEIATGLSACRGRPFPPTLPEFMGLCRPSLNMEAAYSEAVAGMESRRRGEIGEWSHPAVFWAAVKVGQHDLLNMGWKAIQARWEKALRTEFAKGRWPEIPAPMVALPAPGNTTLDREEADKRLQEVGAAAAFGKNGRDPKAWIKRLQERVAQGESLPPAVEQMLKRAQGEAA